MTTPKPRPAKKARIEALEAVADAAEELLAVANLRGDNQLSHPADDPKHWTARMQTAWDDLAEKHAALTPAAGADHA